jgi:hypothetical protein
MIRSARSWSLRANSAIRTVISMSARTHDQSRTEVAILELRDAIQRLRSQSISQEKRGLSPVLERAKPEETSIDATPLDTTGG